MIIWEICKVVINDDSKLSKEIECNIHTEEEISEGPPTMPRHKMRYEFFVEVFNSEQQLWTTLRKWVLFSEV